MLTIVSIYLRLIMTNVKIHANALELESLIQEYDNYPFQALVMVSSERGCLVVKQVLYVHWRENTSIIAYCLNVPCVSFCLKSTQTEMLT